MKLATLHNSLQEAFFRQGWLLPAVLPLTQFGGRALFNVLAGTYALWGLFSLRGRCNRLDRATTLLYLTLLGVFLLGIPGAIDPEDALRTWGKFLSQSLALLLIQAALRESPDTLSRLLGCVTRCGGVTLVGLYLLLLYYWSGLSGQPFNPSTQLREDQLPFLLPFLLGWVWWHDKGAQRYWGMASIVAIALAYVVISEGRAALFGLIVALVVFCKAVLGWRLRWIAGLTVLVLAVAIVANTGKFRKVVLDPEHPLDAFTAGRTALWRQALAHPPERPWLGVGIGNGIYATEILSIQFGDTQVQVRHLHNFLMDVWYETGILGVGMLMALIGTVFWRLAWAWRRLSLRDRQQAGVLLAAALAIMGTATFSFGYTSQHFSYLFVCLGGLTYLGRWPAGAATPPAAADTGPDRR